jgi:hypothetical protein
MPMASSRETKCELKLNEAHQLLPCDDDMNLLDDTTDTIKKNTEPLTDASKKPQNLQLMPVRELV